MVVPSPWGTDSRVPKDATVMLESPVDGAVCAEHLLPGHGIQGGCVTRGKSSVSRCCFRENDGGSVGGAVLIQQRCTFPLDMFNPQWAEIPRCGTHRCGECMCAAWLLQGSTESVPLPSCCSVYQEDGKLGQGATVSQGMLF